MTARFLLRAARLVDPAEGIDRVADLLVEDGRIAAVGRGLPSRGADAVEAAGWLAFPGFIDLHVHLREPGQTQKEDIVSGAVAAARGGFTAVVAMANTTPPVDSPAALAYLLRRGEEASRHGGASVWPCATLTEGMAGLRPVNAEALREAGAVALSDDGRSVADAEVFLRALEGAAKAGLTVLDHAEEPSLAERGVAHDGPIGRSLGLAPRPAVSETAQAARDVAIAQAAGARLHLQHISAAPTVSLVREAKALGLAVTAEATPHHLLLTEDAIERSGSAARVNPPLREPQDRDAVWAGLVDGTIDAIATDHAPHTADDKDRPFAQALPGITGVETAVALLYQEVRARRLGLEAFVDRLAYGPARVLGRRPARLREGASCAITLFNPEEAWTVDPGQFVSRGRSTPFAGFRLVGRPTGILTDKGARLWQ